MTQQKAISLLERGRHAKGLCLPHGESAKFVHSCPHLKIFILVWHELSLHRFIRTQLHREFDAQTKFRRISQLEVCGDVVLMPVLACCVSSALNTKPRLPDDLNHDFGSRTFESGGALTMVRLAKNNFLLGVRYTN